MAAITIWTEEEISYLKENYNSMKIKDISKELNRSVYGIQLKANKLGLVKNIRQRNDGIGVCIIAKAFSTYSRKVDKWNIPFRRNIKSNNNRFIYVDDFWDWAKENFDKLPFDKYIVGSIPNEPRWLKGVTTIM